MNKLDFNFLALLIILHKKHGWEIPFLIRSLHEEMYKFNNI
jgi:hypothetical protein